MSTSNVTKNLVVFRVQFKIYLIPFPWAMDWARLSQKLASQAPRLQPIIVLCYVIDEIIVYSVKVGARHFGCDRLQ